MRRSGLFTLSLILFFLAAGLSFSDEVTVNLQSFIVETFDNPNAEDKDLREADLRNWPNEHRWAIRGSKFSTVGQDENGNEVAFPRMAYIRSFPENLYRREPEGRTLRVLGIHGRFDRLGYNSIEIFPVQTGRGSDGSEQLVPKNILFPGRVRNLDLWVWGSNFDYYLEVHVMDFRGIVHVLPLGSIKYRGWKNLTVNIPNYIPQSVVYAPALRGLQLVKFVMWTRPTEKVDDFYLYFDEIKVLTDTFETQWDGEGLGNPRIIQELWSEAAQNQ